MSVAKRVRPVSKPGKARPSRSAENIAHAAPAHEGQAVPGGKVKLTLVVTLSRAQSDRLTARAISERKNLDAILEAAPTQPIA